MIPPGRRPPTESDKRRALARARVARVLSLNRGLGPPAPGCRRCRGTGREGYLEGAGALPVPCRCRRPKARSAAEVMAELAAEAQRHKL